MPREKTEIPYDEKMDRVIYYFNEKVSKLQKDFDSGKKLKVLNPSKALFRPELADNFLSSAKYHPTMSGKYKTEEMTNKYTLMRTGSPNNISIALQFDFGGRIGAREGRKVRHGIIPSHEKMRKSSYLENFKVHDAGAISISRDWGAGDNTIFEARFGERTSHNMFDGWNDLYLFSPTKVGKKHLKFIKAIGMKPKLEKLVFEEKVNIKRAIDFAFQLYAKPEIRIN